MAKLAERVTAVWATGGGLLILAIMVITSVNVGGLGLDRIARQFGSSVAGLPGYEDFVRLAISSAALMFFPYCQLRRGNLAVDLFVSMLPRGTQRLLDWLWLVAMAGLALFLAYWMTLGMVETLNDNVLSPVLGWSVWPFYLPGIASLLLWAAVGTMQAVGRHADV